MGRICAELISPYPPGTPVLAPGERISSEIMDFLRAGIESGMYVPDAIDSLLERDFALSPEESEI
jgi:arginine/lysine/ornithine decarboxylase